MQNGSGLLIIVFGLLLLYIGVTGRYKCFTHFATCLTGEADCDCVGKNDTSASVLQPLQPLKGLAS